MNEAEGQSCFMTARYTVKFPSEPFQLHGPDCPGLQHCRVSAPSSRRDNLQSGPYCSVQNKKLKLKFFSSRPLPCHSSPLSLFSFFLLIDLTQRLSGKGSAPGYKHPRSVVLCPWWFTTLQEPWCRCILFLPFPGIPILLHTLSVLVPFSFSPNNNGTISLKLLMLINS